jgi:hypothetical protein
MWNIVCFGIQDQRDRDKMQKGYGKALCVILSMPPQNLGDFTSGSGNKRRSIRYG